jgi:hypothetical protein
MFKTYIKFETDFLSIEEFPVQDEFPISNMNSAIAVLIIVVAKLPNLIVCI